MSEAARQDRKPVHGVLLLNKHAGITSQSAVSRVKHLLAASKAGHTGTLDPLAEGLLPVCLGEATKFSQGLLDAHKSYRARVMLGCRTDTGDLEGAVLERRIPEATSEGVAAVLDRFRGEIMQIPPMYSALKRGGRPLYDYAREGQVVERLPRRVYIIRLELEERTDTELQLFVTCSKGTYIRALAEDIGAALGCGACLAALTRVSVGDFSLEGAVTVSELERMSLEDRLRLLLPADALLATLPRVELDEDAASRIRHGQSVRPADGGLAGPVRLYAPRGRFVGVGDAAEDGRIAPRRLLGST